MMQTESCGIGSRRKIIVGIDPDTERNGIGYIRISHEEDAARPNIQVDMTTLPFPETVDFMDDLQRSSTNDGAGMYVYIEAGWMERISNYHPAQGRRAARIAKNVGANHQTGKHLIEMLRHHGITTYAVHPLVKCWQGRDRKITHGELDKITGGLPRRHSNQEERDALLLAWVYAELPLGI